LSGGGEDFTDLAAQCAVGEEQKAEYKKTADLIYSATVAGAAAVGMAKGALRGPKPKGPGATKAAKPLVAREMEIAGTGLKVKVPVEEVPPGTTQAFAARKGDGKGSTNKAPKAKPVEKFAAEAAKNRVMRAYGEGKFWNKLKDVNDPDIRRKLGKINKQAFSGGQIRSDGTFIYKFDKAHQSSKVHLEVYEKVRNNVYKITEERDPETGATIRKINDSGKGVEW
jgi:hypothetical protein